LRKTGKIVVEKQQKASGDAWKTVKSIAIQCICWDESFEVQLLPKE